jgi:hypothetical protein
MFIKNGQVDLRFIICGVEFKIGYKTKLIKPISIQKALFNGSP